MNIKNLIFASLFLTQTTGCFKKSPGDHLTGFYHDIETRRIHGKSTKSDKFVMQVTYRTMTAGASIVYTEAAKVLKQCVKGNGKDVKLPSRYLKNSPVVKKAIKGKKDGKYGPFYLKQTQDVRLSYAYNPFHIEIKTDDKGKKHIKIYEWMKFHQPKKKRGVRTTFFLGPLTFKMSDSLVFVASDCKPFIAYAEWQEW